LDVVIVAKQRQFDFMTIDIDKIFENYSHVAEVMTEVVAAKNLVLYEHVSQVINTYLLLNLTIEMRIVNTSGQDEMTFN
jgi:hypothetical protein